MPDPRDVGFVDLEWLLEMTHDEYLDRFRGTAIRRAKHWMLQRNAAIALGNTGDAKAIYALAQAMRTNPHPVVRGHAAWAIGQIGIRHPDSCARGVLEERLSNETDATAREEIRLAIADLTVTSTARTK
jgi:epoxyqueuosine reductase